MTQGPAAARGFKGWLGIFLRGLAMGVAEVVPGVSGGTIAFVSGIYDELVQTLASFRPRSAILLISNGRQFWQRHNLSFLLILALGMVAGVGLFAGLMKVWLATARPVVWAFFFGVICASTLVLGRSCERRRLLGYGGFGLLFGLLLVTLEPADAAGAPWQFFLAGALAVCAWLLPAISGSYLLLVLGLYEAVLLALTELDFVVLGSLALGCAVGLMSFANLLAWLMTRHREPLLCLLTGFMAGSLVRLWPWSLEGELHLPGTFLRLSGEDPALLAVSIAFSGGIFVIWFVNRLEEPTRSG